jgi:hypothetical protein
MAALGITAMIIAIVAIFVPIVGPYLTLLCALMAAFAGGKGLTFGIVAILLSTINIIFLSPSLWITAATVATAAGASAETSEVAIEIGGVILAGVGIIFIGAQVLALIVLIVVHLIWRSFQPST